MTATFPYESETGLVVVAVHLTGPDGNLVARMALDTGASTTMANEESLQMIGYHSSGASRKEIILTVSGVTLTSRVRVKSVFALGRTRRSFPVIRHNLPAPAELDGLLGLDFFEGSKLTIDFRRHRILPA